MNIDNIVHHYLHAALWTAELDSKEPDDIALFVIEQAVKDVKLFVDRNEKDLIASGLTEDQIGHDFWLARNRHGADFRDRIADKQLANRLVASAQDFKEVNVFNEEEEIIIE